MLDYLRRTGAHLRTGWAGVPSAVVERYLCGQCMWLAQAMHRRYGWSIRAHMFRDVEDERFDYVAHAFCVMPDGREIDILGPQTRIRRMGDYVRDWDAGELLATMTHDPNEPDARRKLLDAEVAVELWVSPRLR